MYAIRIKEGDSWLDVLNEQGEVEQFERFALAVIRIRDLFISDRYREAEIRGNGGLWRFRRASDGEPVLLN